MFERFTNRSRRVVVLSQQEARLLGHSYIGTEHLLLGLIAEHDGVAARALESLGVTLDRARQQVREIVGTSPGQPADGHIPFTPGAKKVLELSLREALTLGSEHIGTEHLLLGLTAEGSGTTAEVLERLGVPPRTLRQQTIELAEAEKEPLRTGLRAVNIVGGRGQALAAIRELLATIDSRLSAIEEHLGIPETGAQPAADDPPAT